MPWRQIDGLAMDLMAAVSRGVTEFSNLHAEDASFTDVSFDGVQTIKHKGVYV